MITIEHPVPHAIAIHLQGVLERADVEKMEKAVREKLQGEQRLCLLVDMTEWSDMTANAIAEDAQFELGLLGKLNRFERMAIVSDKQFAKAAVRYLDPLIPTVDVQVFTSSDRENALAFVSQLPDAHPAPAPAASTIETDRSNLVAFSVDGTITKADFDTILEPLNAAFDRNERVDLLVRLDGYRGFDPSILGGSEWLSMEFEAVRKVRRYAVIGAPSWMETVGKMVTDKVPMEVRFFASSQEAEAWDWLGS